MIFFIIALIAGLAILIGGLYYFIKDKEDSESRKIYLITVLVGAVILVGDVIFTITKL